MIWRDYDGPVRRNVLRALELDAKVDERKRVGKESNDVKEHELFYFVLRIAMPQGRLPTLILDRTSRVDASSTEMSFEGPLAV